jgi:hypothetical protein
MEVVRAAYFFLKEKQGVDLPSGREIEEFLAWERHRVEDVLANLRSTGDIPQSSKAPEEQPPIKKEIFEMLPTQMM